ncbi:MAG TPA: cytochrome P450 [Spongiibacteraceae bacterium]|nr:cytochrome P450 [Spongiibacteraceae bacterium]
MSATVRLDRARPGITLISAEVQKNPFPLYSTLRDRYPVCQVDPDGMWVITRYDDVQFALKNPQIFSSRAFSTIHQPEWLRKDCRRNYFILSQDPPEHTQNRSLINKAFVHRVIDALLPLMRDKARALVAALTVAGDVDFIKAFADPYVASILSHITGTGEARSADDIRHLIGLAQVITPARPSDSHVAALEDAIGRQRACFTAAIQDRRRHPQRDLLSELIGIEVDSETLALLDDEMLISLLDLLVNAGFETTSSVLVNAVIQFARQPGLMQTLQADPALIPAFLEELLRYDPPTHALLRQATQPVTLAGVTIPEDALILVLLAAANRDPAHFSDPDAFIMGRKNIKEHVAFGYGPHACIGAALARLEITVALEELVKNFSAVACPADDELPWAGALLVHVVTELPVRFRR